MRVGKRANVVEAKKTRSCVVRLEKVLSPPAKSTRSAATPGSGSSAKIQQSQDEKKSKGPLKKRPISQQPVSFTNLSSSSTPTIKSKAKPQQKSIIKATITAAAATIIETPPSTIAAGRSRRAIKPNPKYASEDMVTPKSIKNVGALSNRKSAGALGKQRGRSTSSSEDFYNKESSDELADNDDYDEMHDKLYNVDKDRDSDSDFSNGKKKLRLRPKRDEITVLESTRTTQTETPRNSASKSSLSFSKSTPSQLQQLRKTLAASVNRSLSIETPTIGMKRKRESGVGIGSDNDSGITRKRFLLSNTNMKYKTLVRTPTTITKESVSKKENSQTVNGSKIQVHTLTSTAISDTQEKRKLVAEKIANKFHIKSIPVSSKPTTNAITLSKSSANARVIASTKQRSSSPAVSKQPTKTVAAASADKADKESEKKLEESPSSTVDDFETMPTFTIVNINDIINKKGDVLISKTAGKLQKSTENSKAEGNEKTSATAASSSSATSTSAESKLNRRKTGHTTILSEKTTQAAAPKKTIQKILNHSLAKKSIAKTAAAITKTLPVKPAPRILNATVAKKTQPVKPMIANLDDSADESFPLSIDDEDEEDDDEDDNNNGNEDVDTAQMNEDDSFAGGDKRKLTSSTPYLSKKVPIPTTKENSIRATNRIPPTTRATPQRKLSPEKVVISRQGDKIIKKITCFETWYVINLPEERPPKLVRNQLDIPLIKLANVSESVELPSESWSSKVTLHELSAAMVAKSNMITYTGNLKEHNISEEDRARYQPTCVMFRRAVVDRARSRLPYDRAVIFKNKTFFTNIEGKNVKLIGAPTAIGTQNEVEILLQVVDGLTLQSSLVEPATTVQ